MRIAAISDIHGNLAALQAVLQDIEARQVDVVVNLGDILSGPLQPAETADFLMQRDFVTIAGNHERQLLALRDGRAGGWDAGSSDGYAAAAIDTRHEAWLRQLPATHRLAADVLLVHGTPASDLVYWMDSVEAGRLRAATGEEAQARAGDVGGATLVLCGHTHVPRAMRLRDCLVVNPGSVGLQAYESDHPAPHRMEIGSPEARYAVVERGRGGWRVGHYAVPYDWTRAARLADEHGRPEWAHALRTGRMPAAEATAS